MQSLAGELMFLSAVACSILTFVGQFVKSAVCTEIKRIKTKVETVTNCFLQ